MNKINIELEIKRIAWLFAEKQKIKVEVFFRPEGKKFNDEWLNYNGFHSGGMLGLHKLYINLERSSRALIFRTLAHELAHVLQQETEEKHNTSFWQNFDNYTLPFVLDNLSREDRESLLNLSNPTTNRDETIDWVYLEVEERIISFPVEQENIDQQWKVIRQETIKGNLGFKTHVSTKRTSQSKYWLWIYVNDKEGEVARVMERLRELGIDEMEVKVK
ncbi:putative phosphothreonine lyase domain-containg protein [endosymbiont GvMRE of Glomus versiforme]|uniref:putative phosphothreonine lyase domain-containing protein n=1 Tax=endosymbiont GvMRE of Glomus versiforme TaxID=2039283 RepID=UPI0011C40AB4|nr:putative phosphothreonine lyase domain-containg protein [endosymbiont GvMRE of Glomus versiforme]